MFEGDRLEIFPDPNQRDAYLISRTMQMNQRASFASSMLERWAAVSVDIDGEDSAGRQKVQRMPPAEIVSYVCEVSQEAFDEFDRRGWLYPMPGTVV